MILIRQRIELKYEILLSVGNTAFERKRVFLLLFICFWLLGKGIMMEVLSGYSYCIWIGLFFKHLLVCLMHLNVLSFNCLENEAHFITPALLFLPPWSL